MLRQDLLPDHGPSPFRVCERFCKSSSQANNTGTARVSDLSDKRGLSPISLASAATLYSHRSPESAAHPQPISHIHSHQDEIDCTGQQFDALHRVEISIKSAYRCPAVKEYGAWNEYQHSIGRNKGHPLLFLSHELSASRSCQGKATAASCGNGGDKNKQAWPHDEAFHDSDGSGRTEKLDENGRREKHGDTQGGDGCCKPVEHKHHVFLPGGHVGNMLS